MKIMTYISQVAAAAMATMTLAACSDIKTDDRFIEMPPVESSTRVVLMEEFTGQNCKNCPEGHAIMATLSEQYPDNLICVSIHGGQLAYNEIEQVPNFGLANPDSQSYYESFGKPEQPSAIVNRNSDGIIFKDFWTKEVREEIEKKTYLDLGVTANYDAESNTVTVYANLNPHESYDGHLQVWVVENGIVARQNDNGKIVADYVHNHVFRGAVNGLQGEAMKLTPRDEREYTVTFQPKDFWNLDNTEVVAFYYTTDGVVQAAKTHIAKE